MSERYVPEYSSSSSIFYLFLSPYLRRQYKSSAYTDLHLLMIITHNNLTHKPQCQNCKWIYFRIQFLYLSNYVLRLCFYPDADITSMSSVLISRLLLSPHASRQAPPLVCVHQSYTLIPWYILGILFSQNWKPSGMTTSLRMGQLVSTTKDPIWTTIPDTWTRPLHQLQ